MEVGHDDSPKSGDEDYQDEEYDEEPKDMKQNVRHSDAARLDFRYSGCSSSERSSMFRQRLLSVSKQSTSARRISLMDSGMLAQPIAHKSNSIFSLNSNATIGERSSMVALGGKPLQMTPKEEMSATIETKIRNSFVDDGRLLDFAIKEKRPSLLNLKEQGPLKGIRRSSRDAELKRPARKDIWKNSTNVKFDTSVPAPGFSALPGRHVDELAMERSTEGYWQHRLLQKSQAILHHRDSITDARHAGPFATQKVQGSVGQVKAQQTSNASSRPPVNHVVPLPKTTTCPFTMALKRLAAFADCSDNFLSLLATSGEQMRLKVGEVRDMDGSRFAVARTRPAMAVIVVSGMFRIEIAGNVVDECSFGSSFGLANTFSRISIGGGRNDGQGTPVDFVVRAIHPSAEGCRLLAIHSNALKSALTAFPEDLARLHDILRLSSQQLMNSTQHMVALLHCSESAKPAIIESTTRHIFVKGEDICREGMRTPDGIVVVRSGTVTLEINGIEIRQLSKGQGIGEEILFGVCRKWGVTARCTTLCEVQILHRRLFTHWVKEMQSGSAEEKRESDRLLLFLEGRWKEDRVILAWPLFRGYDQDLLATLARLIETRILLPGNKLWECGTNSHHATEVALYVLLCGSCEENASTERQSRPGQASEIQNSKRNLVPGACIGTREFLGLTSSTHMVVVARSLCIVAVLHRDVFISAIDAHPVDVPQAAEITRLLKDALDQSPSVVSTKKNDRGCECLVGSMPMLRGAERRLVERLCNTACKRRFCIAGQSLCRAGVRATTMFAFIRGWANLTIAGIQIKRIALGDAVNVLALAQDAFTPTYTVKCEQTCEVWALSRDDFASCLDAFPPEKGKFSDLLHAPSALAMQREVEKPIPGLSSPCGTRPNSAAASPITLLGDPTGTIATMSLSEIKMFEQCAPAFLEWVDYHLHAMIYFADEIIVREGQEHTDLYIIRSGTIIGEGEGTPQVRLESGRTIGEEQILGISLASTASYQVIDVAVVQVLHQSVWRKAVELFPDQAPLFDKIILSRMDGVMSFELQKTPFFSYCNKDFCGQVERLMRTRLVQPGTVILEEGCEDKVIRIIKSGIAVVQEDIVDDAKASGLAAFNRLGSNAVIHQKTLREPTKHADGASLNIDVAVGATRCATSKVTAETLLAMGEIDGVSFLGVLQRFPNEIAPLLRAAVSGSLWPSEADSVPLFRGVSPRFFDALMSKSAWRMFLPDQCVVKLGGKGDLLFLLCYGVASTEIDDIVVGNALVRGDCIGKLNFLGLVTRYGETVRTRIVCHFRSVAGSALTELLQEHVAERDRFETLKRQVQAEVAENDVLLKEQATREKLRRREQHAFRGHIARERECRGVAPVASTSSLASLLDMPDIQEEFVSITPDKEVEKEDSDGAVGSGESSPQANMNIVATDKDDMQLNLMRKSLKLKPGAVSQTSDSSRTSFLHRMRGTSRRTSKLHGRESLRGRESLKSDSRPSLDPPPSETLGDNPAPGSPRGNVGTISESGTPKDRKSLSKRPQALKGLSFNEDIENQSPCSSFGSDEDEDKTPLSTRMTPGSKHKFSAASDSDDDDVNEQMFFKKMKEMTESQMSKRERMDIAISEHADAREKAILKGRILRMFHSDLRPNSCKRANLSQEDLHELSFHLPRLPCESAHSSSSDFFAGRAKNSARDAINRKQERAAKASPGRPPMQSMSKAAEQILRRKYRQLANQQFGAVVPTAN